MHEALDVGEEVKIGRGKIHPIHFLSRDELQGLMLPGVELFMLTFEQMAQEEILLAGEKVAVDANLAAQLF